MKMDPKIRTFPEMEMKPKFESFFVVFFIRVVIIFGVFFFLELFYR